LCSGSLCGGLLTLRTKQSQYQYPPVIALQLNLMQILTFSYLSRLSGTSTLRIQRNQVLSSLFPELQICNSLREVMWPYNQWSCIISTRTLDGYKREEPASSWPSDKSLSILCMISPGRMTQVNSLTAIRFRREPKTLLVVLFK
jgi:hypothetical protein